MLFEWFVKPPQNLTLKAYFSHQWLRGVINPHLQEGGNEETPAKLCKKSLFNLEKFYVSPKGGSCIERKLGRDLLK